MSPEEQAQLFHLRRILRCPVDNTAMVLRGGAGIHRLWECPSCFSDFREVPPKGKFWTEAEIRGE